MKNVSRIIFLIPVVVILAGPVVLSGCKKSVANNTRGTAGFSSFRDIPGVTEDEIKAIEALKSEYGSFVYGMTVTTETFADSLSGSGEIKGYTALFCNWMTELFGIPFKPALYSWSDLFAGLASGQIDFSGDLMSTEERRQIYIMSQPIAQRSLKAFQIVNSPSIHEIAESRPPRLAFLGASAVLDRVSEAVEYEFETIFVNDSVSAYRMLKNGEADAFLVMGITEASFDEFGDVTAETFLPLVYNSASMSTQNPKLAPVISVVRKLLHQDSTDRYLLKLYEAGYYDYRKNRLFKQFTDEERAYIQNHPVVPIGIDPGNYPACFYDRHEHEWRGSFIDLIREVTSLTGLTFERVNSENSTWSEILQMLTDGRVAIVPELTQSKEREGRFLWPEAVQMIDYYTLISKSWYPDINISEILHYKIGLAKDTDFTSIFRRWFPNHPNTVEYESMEAAFVALQRGNIDMVMANQKRLLYLTHYLELPDYKANIIFDQPLYIKCGINKDETVLCSIFDKTVRMIDTKGISDHWMRRTYDYRSKVAEMQIPWLIGLSILSLVVLALIIVFLVRSRQTGRQLEKIVNQRTHDLKLQTSMLMTILDSSSDFIFCKDMELRYTRCNKSMEDFLNIPHADIIGKNDMEIFGFSPEIAEGYIREDKRVIASKRPDVFEEKIMSQTGSRKELIVETIKTPLLQDGEAIGIMGIARDITKRKATENELALQTTKLQAILDSIPDLVFCKDLNLNFTQCNKVIEKYHGLSEKDLVGKNGMDLFGFSAEALAQILEAEQATIRENRNSVTEERISFRDGVPRILETVRVPLKQDDNVIGLLTIARDITKRKEMEDAALAASRAKSAFLANMSHEIRTPMNSIIGFSELAMDDKIPPRTKEYLDRILKNAEGLLEIINNILDLSKIEAGKMELENIPFNLHELFTSCRSLIIPKAVEKGIVLHFYAEPSIGKRPLGDPTRLREVLLNLLSNAIKFTNTGTVKVHAVIKNKTEKNITMRFEIKDSGIGMTPEQIGRIFEPFVQGESGTTRKYGGTGLGLPITKNIVELMGGKLSVESAPGIGSKFGFELTFDTIDVTDKEVFEKKIILNEIEKPAFEGEILLCEDNLMNQQVICEHLARVGLKTVVAENGKIGVDMVKSRMESGKQFDLIFMDIHMPVMDGLEASEKIIELDPKIPIVAMTANIMSSDREMYSLSGMNDCVSKPFTSQELWRCLMKYLTPVKWQAVNDVRQTQAEEKLRYRLINTFVKKSRNLFSEITGALSAGDIKLAHRLAHTIKGNAGQLDKTLLQQAAKVVENGLKDGKNLVTDEQLETFRTELNAVLTEFQPELDEYSGQEAPEQDGFLDVQSARELLDKLGALLERGNPECRELIGSLQRIPGSEELIQEMEDLDFESAIVTIAELRKRMGIE